MSGGQYWKSETSLGHERQTAKRSQLVSFHNVLSGPAGRPQTAAAPMSAFVSAAIFLSLTLCFMSWSGRASADQVACSANGSGQDTCVIFFPDVLHPTVTYSGVQIAVGDLVSATAAGCVQTGGTDKTWKRYLNPSGYKSDHHYHGLIQVPGAQAAPVRIQSLTGAVMATAAGPLVLGYEDDGFGDNGYYKHDDGTGGQCSDVNGTNHGRAFVTIQITRANPPFLPAGTAFGQCIQQGANTELCHIDRPDVTHATEPYPAVQFSPGDQVTVAAQGCVQTGGARKTWKGYVDPSGNNAGSHYHGLVSIPGATNGLMRIKDAMGKTFTASAGILTLGYEDDHYGDNGYWSHDNGTEDQCKNVGAASLDITITHPSIPAESHVNLDGIEVVQSIQDLDQSVPLVAGKQTWVRVYLSGQVDPGFSVLGTLTVTRQGGAPVSVGPNDFLTLSSDAINCRRAHWSESLNFLYCLPVSQRSRLGHLCRHGTVGNSFAEEVGVVETPSGDLQSLQSDELYRQLLLPTPVASGSPASA